MSNTYYPGKYLSALGKIESLAVSLRVQLEGCGLSLPVRGSWPREILVDSLKFFMKQQQKALEHSKGLVATVVWLTVYPSFLSYYTGDNALKSCQLATCLYLTGAVLDAFTHCSLKTALSEPHMTLHILT